MFYLFIIIEMQYTGTVKFIGAKEEIGANSLIKQTVVLEEISDREFKWGLAVDFFKEKTELLNDIKVGDVITAHLNTRVNESKTQPGKYFNSISCRRVEKGQGSNQWNQSTSGGDDLPF